MTKKYINEINNFMIKNYIKPFRMKQKYFDRKKTNLDIYFFYIS